jgi:hypothetical protein
MSTFGPLDFGENEVGADSCSESELAVYRAQVTDPERKTVPTGFDPLIRLEPFKSLVQIEIERRQHVRLEREATRSRSDKWIDRIWTAGIAIVTTVIATAGVILFKK